jgi:simple sugar transport system ATP-binding protein
VTAVLESPPATAIAGLHIKKRFGHVEALRDASISVSPGEIVALFGDNGAGKSTLVKILLGQYQPDEGSVIIGDEDVRLGSVRDALDHGVECVSQELSVAPDLSVVDNIFLGHEQLRSGPLGRFGVLARSEMAARADVALRELSIALPSLQLEVRDLSGGQRQAVAVARAVMWAHTALLLDEPTAALGARQTEVVSEIMRKVAQKGLGVLIISHDLPRILEVADRVVILWRGETVLDQPAASLTVPDVVAAMVGYGREAR